MVPVSLGFILAIVVLILCTVFAFMGKITTLLAVLIGGLALAYLCLWPRPVP